MSSSDSSLPADADFSQQVKSKKRITDHGEVFTNAREVSAMLDLVKSETERIDSRFLEPACGTGNFLVQILLRKLAVVNARYQSSVTEWERYAILALSSVYGIDLLTDNIAECRHRLYELWNAHYTKALGDNAKEAARQTALFILSRNILWGDALTLKTPEATVPQPIVFSEWSSVTGALIKRRDYTLSNLLGSGAAAEGPNLFSDLGDRAFLPQVLRDYPMTHYLKLPHADPDWTAGQQLRITL